MLIYIKTSFSFYSQEMLQSNSKLRSALPDLIRLLIDFTLLCIRLPNRECFAYLENNVSFIVILSTFRNNSYFIAF